MKKITLIFLISLLLHFGLPPAQADNAPVKIGVYQNQPLAFVNEDGEVSGFCIDIIEEIADIENWAIEYTSCGFSDCLDLLENREIDLLCPIAYSQERAQRFDFNATTLISNWGHVYTQPNSDIESYLDLQGKTVAILENDIHAIVFQQMLERFDITCDFVLVEDYSSVFDSIEKKSVDAGVVNRLFSQQHEASYQVSSSTMIFNPIEVRFAGTKNQQTNLLQAIDNHLVEYKAEPSSVYYQSIDKWLGGIAGPEFPKWPTWVLISSGGLLLLLLGGNLILRAQVTAKTKELEAEIGEHKRTMVALQEGEEKYRSLIEHSSDAIYLLNGNRFEVINRRFTEIFGVTTEEASSDDFDFMQLIAPSSRPMIAERTRKLEQGEDLSSRYEFTALDKSGNEMDFDVSVSYIPYQGKTATQGILRDITERVRSEKVQEKLTNRIRGQARQMLQIMETVPEGVVLLNANGRVMLANPVARASLQTLANANVGDELTKLGDQSLKKLLNSPPQGLWHEVRAGNQIFELIARPVEHYPEPQNWVMLIKDITQERETQKRIQQQEQLATVGQLAAGIAHDFNNIIATIVLYAQMTELADEIPETVRQRMVTIDQQAQHASKLIQQILDFSRQAVLERRPIELLPLVKEQVKLLKRTLPENITISLAQNQESYVVHADPTRMRQMITNLAVNARDAMSAGGEFHINLERAHFNGDKKPPLAEMEMGEWVLITASDTGTGIPEEVLPRIFEPFFTTKAPLGSGLGLAQVHGIVAQHNGFIDVTTQANKGTTFAIYLPAMPIAPTIMPPTSAPALVKGNGETILVVEDEWAVRKVLVDSLKSLNYHGLQAPNGKEAIKVLSDQAEQVALILSDVVMPEMGGVALLHQLRSQGLSVPIILMTGHPMERELKELRSQGLDAWLLKPPRLEKLAQTIAQVLRSHSA